MNCNRFKSLYAYHTYIFKTKETHDHLVQHIQSCDLSLCLLPDKRNYKERSLH